MDEDDFCPPMCGCGHPECEVCQEMDEFVERGEPCIDIEENEKQTIEMIRHEIKNNNYDRNRGSIGLLCYMEEDFINELNEFEIAIIKKFAELKHKDCHETRNLYNELKKFYSSS